MMMTLIRLYLEFFKAGLLAVGGGLATLPFLSEIADETGWFTHAQLADMIAVSESTPGPMGVNCGTYVGFATAGIPGAVIATLGLITPSIIIILIIASFLKNFKDNPFVVSVFKYLRPLSVALIAVAGISVAKIALFTEGEGALYTRISLKAVILAVLVYIFSSVIKKTKGLHPIIWIALSAVAGILFF
ncbi:chromate transporter [Lachnospiraceae bacterium C1.1]